MLLILCAQESIKSNKPVYQHYDQREQRQKKNGNQVWHNRYFVTSSERA